MYFVCSVRSQPSAVAAEHEAVDLEQYTTDLINNLLPKGYNKNLRPNYGGKCFECCEREYGNTRSLSLLLSNGTQIICILQPLDGPVNVNISIFINDINAISETAMVKDGK